VTRGRTYTDGVDERIEQLRATVAATPPAPDVMTGYLEKVHTRAYTITDRDVQALQDAGLSEDEIFEQTVAAAISEGLRRLDAAAGAIG
jgi:alkylhydroperoxidase family enzyme